MFRTAPDRVVVSEKSRRDHVSFILWKIRRMRYLPSAWNLGFLDVRSVKKGYGIRVDIASSAYSRESVIQFSLS